MNTAGAFLLIVLLGAVLYLVVTGDLACLANAYNGCVTKPKGGVGGGGAIGLSLPTLPTLPTQPLPTLTPGPVAA